MDSLMGNIPEILISAYLIVGIFVALAFFVLAVMIGLAILRVIKSVAQIVENIQRTSDLAINRIIEPLQESFSFKNAAGSATNLLTNVITGIFNNSIKKQEGKTDEAKAESKKKQKWGQCIRGQEPKIFINEACPAIIFSSFAISSSCRCPSKSIKK